MTSIIEGYQYDIFISYRQKDNKHDGWVTKFVDNLKGELEATFKEDVSVYFDENPHDRLQETHNVDKSLEGKLKCLIFIPILSQTYCDPNSYAWQYEFLAFLRMAEQNHFGKDVKLRSGNVASRILPIRIHDLEQEDVKLFEKETGSVLRAMDFVFKTATGVNRPLKVNEDHPQDNLNRTFYSDQINKVAHAIKEIILGMKTEPVQVVKEKDQVREPSKEVREDEKKNDLEKPAKTGISKLLASLAVLAVLIMAVILVYPKIFKKNSLEELRSSGERISVAVIPFKNMTNDSFWDNWQDGIQYSLISYLSNFPEDLAVRQTESTNNLIQIEGLTNYASITPSHAGNLSRKLGADVFIYGSIHRAASKIRLNAQLINSKTEEVFKSFEVDGLANEEMILSIIDSLRKQVTDFLLITRLKQKEVPDYIQFETTSSPEAYRNYISGMKALSNRDWSKAIEDFSQAIKIDSSFWGAMIWLSSAYIGQASTIWSNQKLKLYDEAKRLCLLMYKNEDHISPYLKIWLNYSYAFLTEPPPEKIKYLLQLSEFDDQDPYNHYYLGIAYNSLEQYEKAIPEFEKALETYKKWGTKPDRVGYYTNLGTSYYETGKYRKEKKLYREAEKLFSDNYSLIARKSIRAISEGDTLAAREYIDKYISIRYGNSEIDWQNLFMNFKLPEIYNKAEEYFREQYSLYPESPAVLNYLAWFLIETDRNVAEGLKLVNKALEKAPDSPYFLDCKGWGLYKQGKYREALEVLEKAYALDNPGHWEAVYDHILEVKKAIAGQKNN
jgi:tetratricopeptide (TPR) repeat protein